MIDKKSKLFSQFILTYKKPTGDFEDLITWAENNRVLYPLAVLSPDMKRIESVGKEWIIKLKKTLKEIKNVLNQDEYLVTRTYKYIEYVTFDVDLFVNNFSEVVKKFKEQGFIIESHDSSLGGRIPGMQVNIKKEGLLTIDLHQDFTWQKRKFLDSQLVMECPIKRNIAGQSVFTPQPEIELLLCIADISHERFNITLLDLIWLEGLSREIKNWEFIFSQADQYKWLNIFTKMASIINQMSLDIYGKILIPGIASKNGSYTLPYFLNLFTCWEIYLNTLLGAFGFPITSLIYMHYNQFKYLLTNQMPYYSPWHKI